MKKRSVVISLSYFPTKVLCYKERRLRGKRGGGFSLDLLPHQNKRIKKKMSETASLFSTTTTLYDVPTLRGNYSSGGGLIPLEDCFLVLFIDHDKFKVNVDEFTRAGFPAAYDRVSEPSGSSQNNTLAKMNLKKKRLQVQFPRECLLHARITRNTPITSLDQLRLLGSSKRSSTGRMMTLFDSLEHDLVGVQTRTVLDVALSILFKGFGINSPIVFYPPQSVLVTPRWAVAKDGATATSNAQWATVSFVSPPSEGNDSGGETRKEAEKRYLESLSSRETGEEILQRLFIPSQRTEEMLNDLLHHLENRGAIWQKAGHATRPSIKNRNPQDRPEFVVLGLFPKVSVSLPLESLMVLFFLSSLISCPALYIEQPFLERCKEYHRKGVPMPDDLTEAPKSKLAPLVTTNSHNSPRTDIKGAASMGVTPQASK